MRLFIAVQIDPEIRKRIAKWTRTFHYRLLKAVFSPEKNIHITLRFLGSTDRETADEVIRRLTPVYSEIPGFEVRFRGGGAFPRASRPRVIFVHPDRGRETVCDLARRTEKALSGLFPPEKRTFRAHATSARVKKVFNAKAVREMIESAAELDFGAQTVTGISLVKSDLRRSGARYSELHRWELK